MSPSAWRAMLREVSRGMDPNAPVPVPAGVLLGIVGEEGAEEEAPRAAPAVTGAAPAETWREKLWSVPAETRIGVAELAEALTGDPSKRHFIYKRTSEKGTGEDGFKPIPCRKRDGALVFVVGEVRQWIRDSEEVVFPGRAETGEEVPRLRVTRGGRR